MTLTMCVAVCSCNSLNKKDIESLQDKQFYLTEVSFENGAFRNDLFFTNEWRTTEFTKKIYMIIPFKEVINTISKEYNVTVNSSEFESVKPDVLDFTHYKPAWTSKNAVRNQFKLHIKLDETVLQNKKHGFKYYVHIEFSTPEYKGVLGFNTPSESISFNDKALVEKVTSELAQHISQRLKYYNN